MLSSAKSVLWEYELYSRWDIHCYIQWAVCNTITAEAMQAFRMHMGISKQSERIPSLSELNVD